jgi:hypothetical protein
MLLANAKLVMIIVFLVQTTVNMIVNYVRKTFIVQATGRATFQPILLLSEFFNHGVKSVSCIL